MDPFCLLETNWVIFGGLIWKAGFSFGPNFPCPFSVRKWNCCENFLSKQFTLSTKESTKLCVILLKKDAKLAETVTVTLENDRSIMVNLTLPVENLKIWRLVCPKYTRFKLEICRCIICHDTLETAMQNFPKICQVVSKNISGIWSILKHERILKNKEELFLEPWLLKGKWSRYYHLFQSFTANKFCVIQHNYFKKDTAMFIFCFIQ